MAGRGRSGWGSTEGVDRLAALTARLDEALAARGWDPETRPFRAHVTLARTDGARSGPATAAALREAAADLSVVSAVDRLVLYESVTGGGPARYVPLEEAPLGAPADGAAGHVEASRRPGRRLPRRPPTDPRHGPSGRLGGARVLALDEPRSGPPRHPEGALVTL